MKYIHNHPKQNFAEALHLDKKAESRLRQAISKAYENAVGDSNGTLSFDDFVNLVAPYVHSPEEGFFAAITMVAEIETAKNIYYSEGN